MISKALPALLFKRFHSIRKQAEQRPELYSIYLFVNSTVSRFWLEKRFFMSLYRVGGGGDGVSSKNPQISRLHTEMVAQPVEYSASSYHITNEKCVWLCWFKTYFSVINVSLSSVPRATSPNHHQRHKHCTRQRHQAAYPKLLIWKFSPSHASFVWLFGLEKEYHSTKNDLFSLEKYVFFWPPPHL